MVKRATAVTFTRVIGGEITAAAYQVLIAALGNYDINSRSRTLH
jgi:hypothetical protein